MPSTSSSKPRCAACDQWSSVGDTAEAHFEPVEAEPFVDREERLGHLRRCASDLAAQQRDVGHDVQLRKQCRVHGHVGVETTVDELLGSNGS